MDNSIAIDGDTMVVGALQEDSNQTTITASTSPDNRKAEPGAVYFYSRNNAIWTLQACIKAPNRDNSDQFG